MAGTGKTMKCLIVMLLAALLCAAACAEEENEMILMIGEEQVPVVWEDNPSVEAIRELLPLTVEMSMYGGFEQVGPIGQEIVRNDEPTETGPGDIVLYAGNQIVVFYGNNSWAYTRLGHIDLTQEEMKELLGHGAVTLTVAAGTPETPEE